LDSSFDPALGSGVEHAVDTSKQAGRCWQGSSSALLIFDTLPLPTLAWLIRRRSPCWFGPPPVESVTQNWGTAEQGMPSLGQGKKGGGYVHKINSSNISLLMWRDYL